MSRIVLVGSGHAHLHLVKNARDLVRGGHELVLLAPGSFWYSGLATGVLAGNYSPDLDRIDVARLCAEGGGRFVRDRMVGMDPSRRVILRAGGDPIPWDVCSLNLGSEVPTDAIPGASRHGRAVKPVAGIVRLGEELDGRFDEARPRDPVRVLVVGGGATGCEVASCVDARARRRNGPVHVTLAVRGPRILSGFGPLARRAVRAHLEDRPIRCRLRTEVARLEEDRAITTSGDEIPFDVAVVATGLVPSRVLGETGLPLGPDGGLKVDRHLRSVGDPTVHGGGDCIAFPGPDLPRIGVHAVREAPVLLHNLRAALSGAPPRPYRPQRSALLILNLGDGTGVLTWGRFAWRSRWAYRLKDWIDRRFLEAHRPSHGGSG